MSKYLKFAAFFLSVFATIIFSSHVNAGINGKLTVEIDGLRNDKGQVCISLFNSSVGFPSDGNKSVEKKCVPIKEKPLFVTYEKLKFGSYAITMYHDENMNGEIDRDVLGIPSEGFGFSNNPVIRDRAPKFGEAMFLVAGENTTTKLEVKYSIF